MWGALECINAGITTLVDWAHIMNTPDHADASVSALQATGIRSVFAYGFPNTSLVDWWFGPDYTGSVLTRTVTRRAACDRSTPPTMTGSPWASPHEGPASASPTWCVMTGSWPKSFGINITVHVAMDRFGYTKARSLRYVTWTSSIPARPTSTPRTSVTRSGSSSDSGGNVSFAPQIEIQMGHGWAPAVTAVEYDVPIGLSDVATTASADQFTQMHAVFGSERGRKHQEAGRRPGWPGGITRSHHRGSALMGHDRWSRGGRDLRSDRFAHTGEEGGRRHHRRVGGECGADYRPGRRIVCAADISNVKTVLVDGEILKEDFKLEASLDAPAGCGGFRDYLLEMFGDPEPGWAAGVLGD